MRAFRNILFVFTLSVIISGFGNAHAAGKVCNENMAGMADFDFFVEYLTLNQYDATGVSRVKETGPIAGIAYSGYIIKPSGLSIRPKFKAWYGKMNYEGDPWGTMEKTHSDNYGLSLEGDFGAHYHVDSVVITPFLGLGYRLMYRNIDPDYDVNGAPVPGFKEIWQSIYWRLGGRFSAKMSKKNEFFIEAGVKRPLYNTVEFSVDGATGGSVAQGIDMNPEKTVSLFGEIGFFLNRLKLSAYYEEFNSKKSDDKNMGGTIYFIPQTDSYVVGVSIGKVF